MLRKTLSAFIAFALVMVGFGAAVAPEVSAWNFRDRPNNRNPISVSSILNFDETQNLYTAFDLEITFNDADLSFVFDTVTEYENDDDWCDCAETEVVTRGYGRNRLGKQWVQTYSAHGIDDTITYTRIHYEKDAVQQVVNTGSVVSSYSSIEFSENGEGGVVMSYKGLSRFEAPAEFVPEESGEQLVNAVVDLYVDDLVPYVTDAGGSGRVVGVSTFVF